MHPLILLCLILYALAILGCLIANLVIGIDIKKTSEAAANSSARAANASESLDNGLKAIKEDVKKLYEWIITHSHI